MARSVIVCLASSLIRMFSISSLQDFIKNWILYMIIEPLKNGFLHHRFSFSFSLLAAVCFLSG